MPPEPRGRPQREPRGPRRRRDLGPDRRHRQGFVFEVRADPPVLSRSIVNPAHDVLEKRRRRHNRVSSSVNDEPDALTRSAAVGESLARAWPGDNRFIRQADRAPRHRIKCWRRRAPAIRLPPAPLLAVARTRGASRREEPDSVVPARGAKFAPRSRCVATARRSARSDRLALCRPEVGQRAAPRCAPEMAFGTSLTPGPVLHRARTNRQSCDLLRRRGFALDD